MSNRGLTNLYGIEVYSNLKYLTCNDNPGLTKIDVRKLTKLETLQCERNAALTELKVNGLSNLWALSCSSNKLSELNLTGLTSLEIFYCHENRMTHLDITMLPALTKLKCGKQELPSGVSALSLYMTEEQYLTMWPGQGWAENSGVRVYPK